MNIHVAILVIGLTVWQTHAEYHEDTWQEPNAWERHSAFVSTSNTCPVCDAGEDGTLALFYYKKLIANLFSKNTLQENEYNSQLEKTILFRLSPAQLVTIETSEDIRDLDAVISDILSRAKTVQNGLPSKESAGFLWLIVDIFKDFLQLLKITLTNPELRFGVLAVSMVLLIWFIHKRYKTSLLAIVVIGVVLFGYICTYLECNRKLETEKVVEFLKENEQHVDGNFFQKAFNSIFQKTDRDKQISKIQKESKINLPFCRPDHVFLIYVNEIFLNQFQLITEKCVEMIVTFKDKFPFPLNIVAIIALVSIFWLVLPLIFKYMLSPSAWFNVIHGINTDSRHQSPTIEHHLPKEQQNDRISGENLKVILELLKNNGLKPENNMLSSGVQEIHGPSEPSTNEDVSDKSLSDESINSEGVNDKKIEKKS